MSEAFPWNRRPLDDTPVSTEDLGDTPRRDRFVSARAWREAPPELLELGRNLGDPEPEPVYLRRIGPWLLWRAGPPAGAEASYLALDSRDLDRTCRFRLQADGSGQGTGPSGQGHTRFRTWKEDLRDAGPA